MASVGVIGAGIAGLAAAYRLEQAGHAPVVFERRTRPGGLIYSKRFDAPGTEGTYLVEFGPNSLRTSTPLLDELLDALDLTAERVAAHDAARRRYVVFCGKPVVLPFSVRAFLRTELFSPRAKMRLLAEPFIGQVTGSDESVADFARRRLGQEVLDYGLNPFTAGVFAGDPEQLSVQHAFPRLHALEAEHGSLIGGGLKRAAGRLLTKLLRRGSEGGGERTGTGDSGPFSLKDGLSALPRALAGRLSEDIRYRTEVRSLHRAEDGRWRVCFAPSDAGDGREDDRPDDDEQTFDALVWSASLPALFALTPRLDADFAPLEDVSYPPVSVVATGFPREAVEHPLDGFGMLVPEAEDGCRTLGTLFSSTVFPHRAPEGHVLLTTFVGGTRAPALAEAPDAEVYEAVEHDLRHLLGAHTPPSFRQRIVWPDAIPQYHVGYGRVKESLARVEADCPGLHLAGNYRAGVSVGDAAESGDAAARRIIEHFGERTDGATR